MIKKLNQFNWRKYLAFIFLIIATTVSIVIGIVFGNDKLPIAFLVIGSTFVVLTTVIVIMSGKEKNAFWVICSIVIGIIVTLAIIGITYLFWKCIFNAYKFFEVYWGMLCMCSIGFRCLINTLECLIKEANMDLGECNEKEKAVNSQKTENRS